MSRFSYVRYDNIRASKQAAFKSHFEALESQILALPKGRAQSLALTALEETYMWVGKGLRDEQIEFDGCVTEEPHRGEVKP